MRYLLTIFLFLLTTSGYVQAKETAPMAKQSAPNATVSSAKSVVKARDLLDGYRGDSGELMEARRILEAAIKQDPRDFVAYREMARYFIMSGHVSSSQFEAGSLEAAESSLKKAIDIKPKYAEAYVLAGHLYRLMKRPVDAKLALAKADKIGTNDPWLQNNWADVLIDEGN